MQRAINLNFKGASWTKRRIGVYVLCVGAGVCVWETAERSVQPAVSLMNLCLAQ